MLTLEDVDRLESYLFNATLQQVPQVFGKVLPVVFAELRTLVIAMDAKSQEFFSQQDAIAHVQMLNDRRAGEPVSQDGRGGAHLDGGAGSPARVEDARCEGVLRQLPQAAPPGPGSDHRGHGVAPQVGAGSVDSAGVGQSVGGAAGTDQGNGPATGSQPDVVVKKRRGRPPKARLELEPSPRLQGGE